MIKAVVTDIEGTTSSISFVKDVLFPYAAKNLPAFVAQHHNEPMVAAILDDVRALMPVSDPSVEEIVEQLLAWISEDKKITPLKALQGMIWEEGYRSGDYQAHVYPDAVEKLRQWNDEGFPLYIYSSGSVKAQKLFFGYSCFGDLNPLFQGYFDTTTGGKQETGAYRAIARKTGVDISTILFLSDIKGELDAASAAGMQVCWLVRPEDSPFSIEEAQQFGFPVVTDFHQINFNDWA